MLPIKGILGQGVSQFPSLSLSLGGASSTPRHLRNLKKGTTSVEKCSCPVWLQSQS